ncbi:MAG: M20/M25/M40 family metallo-hydrolase [Kofleriaceae bacterium]|nr:M20/M25/M40 family metallo-hydrolase [Kofleriaceae bacterium]
MARLALVVATLAAACAQSAQTDRRYVTVDTDAVATAQAVSAAHDAHLEVLTARDGVALLAFDADDLEALSHAMHEKHGRCGGFMLHDSRADAEAALVAAPARTPIEYTLDRASQVERALAAVDSKRIRSTIGELSAMKNRYYLSESGAAASAWLRDRWRSFTARTDVTIELFDQGYPQKSVIMTIPGTERPDEVIVIGGHLDSIAPGGANSTAPGADDDASGIATLTEVARVLLQNDYRPARTIQFMAYAAEEVGLRGSQAIVRDYKKRNVNVIGALQLDMTNYQGSDADIWLINDHTSQAQNTFLVQLIERYVGATWSWDKCGYACSDHASWHRAGVPASMPFEARFKDSNKRIHTARDTLENSDGNATHAAKFARLGAAYAIELAKGDFARVATTPAPAPASDHGLTKLLLGLGLAGLGMYRLRRR